VRDGVWGGRDSSWQTAHQRPSFQSDATRHKPRARSQQVTSIQLGSTSHKSQVTGGKRSAHKLARATQVLEELSMACESTSSPGRRTPPGCR